MAEKISTFTIQTHRSTKYPWHEWTDGSIWRITKGEDFQSTPVSMVGTLYSRAKRLGMIVTVARNEHEVEFQFKKKVKAATPDRQPTSHGGFADS